VITTENKTIEQNIRSGQQIYVKGADLIIRGTVGAGAEVIADGNIHIYGALRGKAIAGAGGDASKKIYCYNMQPELISIAGNYWLSDNLQGDYWGKPVCIGLQDGQLMLAELF
jgi:septum site-determining protein MinC